MKSDEYFMQWQRMKNGTLDAVLAQASFLKPVNAKNTENKIHSHSPDDCLRAENIVQVEERIAFLQETVTTCAEDMQSLRSDINDWITTIEERITAVAAQLLGIKENVTAHPI